MTFQAVLFDLDGVITDTAEYHYRAWKKLAGELGIEIDRSFNEQLKGVSREDSLKRILAFGGKEGEIGAEEFARLAERKNDSYIEMIAAITPDDVFPGICRFWKPCGRQARKSPWLRPAKTGRFCLKNGADTFFGAIADPGAVAHSKPAPDIFLAAAKGVGTNIRACLGIEDALAGVQAIKAAGALPVGVGRAQDLGDDIAIVAGTAELTLAYLEEVWRQAQR